MSTPKQVIRSVESIRSALAEAKAMVEKLETELVAAEQAAADSAVLAMVDGVLTPDIEPEVFFGREAPYADIGPERCGGKVALAGICPDREFSGAYSGYLRAYGEPSGGIKWDAYFYYEGCVMGYRGSGSWAFAVGLLRGAHAAWCDEQGYGVAA